MWVSNLDSLTEHTKEAEGFLNVSDWVTNVEVLLSTIENSTFTIVLKKKVELMNTNKRREISYHGHVMRNNKLKLLQLILLLASPRTNSPENGVSIEGNTPG